MTAVKPPTREAGVTLIELLTALGVGAILLVIAVPSFNNMMASNRLTTAANALVAPLNQTRMEAIRRNGVTQFCSNSSTVNTADALGAACGTAAGAAFALNPDATTTRINSAVTLPPGVVIQSGTNIRALRYNGQGLGRTVTGTTPYTGLVADLSTSRLSTNHHRCIYLTTGSIISVCTRSSNCPANEPTPCQ